MKHESQALSVSTGPIKDLVPLKFWRSSGIDKYQFQVRSIDPMVLPAHLKRRLRAKTFPSIACAVIRHGVVEHIVVPASACPKAHEALTLLARLTGETPRIERYIDIHRAYECVVTNRNVDYSSLRHALAHASTNLTQPSTVRSLQARFGTVVVDPRKYSHPKELYRCMGGMLIEIDNALATALLERWHLWGKPSRRSRSLDSHKQIGLFG